MIKYLAPLAAMQLYLVIILNKEIGIRVFVSILATAFILSFILKKIQKVRVASYFLLGFILTVNIERIISNNSLKSLSLLIAQPLISARQHSTVKNLFFSSKNNFLRISSFSEPKKYSTHA